jgi:carboxypeptidase PM20D1
MPGVKKDIAFIGTSEKGYLSLELSVAKEGGHSSVPGKQSTIGILGGAVSRLEKHPLPARLDESVRQMLNGLAPELPFFKKMVVSNLWLFKKMVIRLAAKDPLLDSLIRTTTAVTMFKAGIKDNVLAPEARAVVNFRILPGETPESVVEHVKTVIHDDRVRIRIFEGARAPSPLSRIDSEAYKYLSRTIAGLFPGVIISPALTMAATDAWHYTSLSPDVYRFMPIRFNTKDLKRIHGVNERISVDSYKECVNFYYGLMAHIYR